MHGDKDEKTIIEKLVDTVKSFASDVATTASNAAQYAMEPDGKGIDPNMEAVEEKITKMYTLPTGAVAIPLAVPKKRVFQNPNTTKPAPNLSGRITPTYDIPIPGPMMPMGMAAEAVGKKETKTAAKKTAPKVAKKAAKQSNEKPARKKFNKHPKASAQSGVAKVAKKRSTNANR
jgi:hypothetical protein